ncbi:oxalate:formate antiporter [Plakobranchus ocellatus]|uniref:Oxalate:formate antiporter n=1 Tax=Plakobranchus ocellatus TaxID=259542 RepID=A0AAV4AK87_9GAST|nr:oxalate:formate antiporter [Plakobranchus ocellatus]
MALGSLGGCPGAFLTKILVKRYELITYGSNKDHNGIIKVSQSHQSVPSSTKLENSTGNIVERVLHTTSPPESILKSWKPSDTVKTPVFHAVWLFGASLLYGLILKSNYYKQFALLYINDDKFLTLVGTLIPIISTVSRIIFGVCLDKGLLSMKGTVVLSLSLQIILCAFWFFAPQVNAVIYLILILCLALTQCMVYSIIPTAAFHIFGPEHFFTNYGLFLSKNFLAGFLTPLVISPLLDILGWFWVFTSVSIASMLALVYVILTNCSIN